MRIIFMGTPDFAVASLEALIEAGHEIISVFTQPDKPKGRGHKMQFSPVKEAAVKHNIEVFQPQTLKDAAIQEQIVKSDPEIIVVAAYGKILPKKVLDIPKFGCVNVHGSILPKYRGAAPIQWSVINGEKYAGITTMYMGEGLDTGDILLTRKTEIGENETSGELFERLSHIGAELLVETIDKLQNNEVAPQKQDESQAVYAPMLSKELALIDWNRTAESIRNLIRGLNPQPAAFTLLDGAKFKIFSADILEASGTPGAIFTANKSICVYCADKALRLGEIQAENGKRMMSGVYLLGHPIKEGSVFSR